MTEVRRQSNSFVLRIWWEEGETDPFWRGWVQHAASGETRYFDQLQELLAFVETQTGPLAKAGSTSEDATEDHDPIEGEEIE